MRKYRPKPKHITDAAKKKIRELFKQAEENPEYADRYVHVARKIAMKNKVPIPKELKRKFCKHCYKYFKEVKVRRTDKGIVYTCPYCKKQMRFPLK